MTHIPVQLPLKGFTEQSQYSAVPPGMTPSCQNMMPSDVWNGRTRISTRNATKLFNTGAVQFMGTYRVYESGALVENLIVVRGGKIYYGNPRDGLTASLTLFGDGTTQTSAPLNVTGFVEGVQFNEHFFFVDGDHYIEVHLHAPSHATAVSSWGVVSPASGPFYTDPATVTAGCRATLICRWGARLVLAGYRDTPNIWFSCAPDEPYNSAAAGHSATADGWDAASIIGAVTGTTASSYGTLGDPVVAVFPFAQSGLMFACTNSVSFLTSDPLFEESVNLVSLSRSIGISGRRAWCQSQEKGAFILGNDGLYFISPNDFNFNRASRVSAGRLDSFFLRLDFGTPAIGGSGPLAGGTLRSLMTSGGSGSGAKATTVVNGGVSSAATDSPIELGLSSLALISGLESGEVFPCLCYDPDREGIWMFLSVSGVEETSLHIYYDLKTDSFWPQRFADPAIYAPTSALYVGTSRTVSGRLFMGGDASISIIDRGPPLGVDGWTSEMEDTEQMAQLIRSSLTMGPVMASLPYRTMLSEVRVDLADDTYETPDGFNDLSVAPILSVSSGDTAQSALGLQTDTLFVINLNELVIDGGSAGLEPSTPVYDGGSVSAPSPSVIDGRFAYRPFGQYDQDDPFAIGISRVYTGPGYWIIRWDTLAPAGPRWVIERVTGGGPTYTVEYQQLSSDPGSPDGSMETVIQIPILPDVPDNASVSGASFPDSLVTEIDSLVPGRNDAKKCRIRAEAMYLTIASDGKPWSIERMSAVLTQVGKSRGGV